jgi:Cu/Ag efflux protein CusF
MTARSRLMLLAVILLLVSLPGCSKAEKPAPAAAPAAQPAEPAKSARPATKPLAFKGKVEAIDPATKQATVAGENVEGWMGAMTMIYVIEPPEVLSTLKVGDQITATVYEGTFSTLYDVKVVPTSK